MSKIDKDKTYNVNIDEEAFRSGKNMEFDDTVIALVDSMTNYLLNGNNVTEKYLLFNKLDKHYSFFYASMCENWEDLNNAVKHISSKRFDVDKFIAIIIDTSILPKEEAMKSIKNMFYESFRGRTGINELIMFDLTTKLYIRSNTGEWKEYIQG